MNWTVVQRILGLLLMMFSLTMLPPILIALLFGEQAWLPFVEACGIDVVLSGHDHHQEHLAADDFDQIIQGAAGKIRSVGERSADYEASQRFAAGKYGFALLRIRPQEIDVTFYGYEPGSPEEFGVIYEATIEAGRAP